MSTNYILPPTSHHHSHNLVALLGFCIQVSKTVQQLKQTHARLLRTGADPPQLLPLLAKRSLQFPANLRYARQVFDEIPHCEDQFLWTSFIRSYSHNAQFSESISLYAKMHRCDVPPSTFTLSSVLNACARLPAIHEGKQTHNQIVKSGFFYNIIVQTALLDMYAKSGIVDDARRVFDGIPDRDVVSWTAMISGYTKIGRMDDASQLFDEMPERNVVSWTAMVAGYANSGNVRAAKELFDKMPKRNAVSWTAMIAGYGKCGDVVSARRIFDEMPMLDADTWAAMIACYAQNGYSEEAIAMYKEMKRVKVKTSEVAVVGAISACTQLGDANVANSLADDVERGSCEFTLVVANAVIHMHSKCGSMDRACKVFDKMPARDAISYTTLITGLADHGRAQEALDFFTRMKKEGVVPNQITFIGVLNACSHAGMVDKGCEYFDMMRSTHRIVPLTEHYACMVDLLGRAGRLEKAHELIEGMDGAWDAGVWGALLGACRIHCNAQLGELAARHLFEIEPENSGNYVLLSNIYASRNQWDEAERVRKMMSERGMRKSPGCSWISR